MEYWRFLCVPCFLNMVPEVATYRAGSTICSETLYFVDCESAIAQQSKGGKKFILKIFQIRPKSETIHQTKAAYEILFKYDVNNHPKEAIEIALKCCLSY